MDEAPLAACPQCGGEVRKLVSAPAVQFKGSGWYVTDYAGKKGASSGKSETKTESKSESSSGESKSASKTESKPSSGSSD
jgi:predicted nucleic acid-binding Zn ribbon protein